MFNIHLNNKAMLKRTLFLIQLLMVSLFMFSQGVLHQIQSPRIVVDTFPVIFNMIGMVDTTIVLANIQHLQDYGTRNCKKTQAIQAQNWIKGHFENYGLSVEIQDFPFGSSCSDNVLGTLTGQVYPNEYVIIGGHYDSYTGGAQEPGADDNASGTAGVMETARILSQFEFERSIVFCAFSAEEYGMIGSEAYASRAQQEGMDILGYFNLDMIGYNEPGEDIHTDMIAPASAEELSDFYKAISAIYIPDFLIFDAIHIPGGSDHMSFNNHGYMGIFPCEEDQTYSPFIHTSNDLIGTSVNSPLKAQKFIQAALASVVSLARPYSTVGQEEKTHQKQEVKLFPNPASEQVFIELSKPSTANLEIFTMTGNKIKSTSIYGKHMINVSELSSGCYIVKVTGADFTLHEKLVIR
jgi:hypothetical protein